MANFVQKEDVVKIQEAIAFLTSPDFSWSLGTLTNAIVGQEGAVTYGSEKAITTLAGLLGEQWELFEHYVNRADNREDFRPLGMLPD